MKEEDVKRPDEIAEELEEVKTKDVNKMNIKELKDSKTKRRIRMNLSSGSGREPGT